MASNLGKALIYKVIHDSGVMALIGTRFYQVKLPQTVTIPAAVFQLIPTGENVAAHKEATVLPKSRVQITCFGETHEAVDAIDQAIKKAIDGKRENWGTGSYITAIQMSKAVSTPVDGDDPETGLFTRARDYFIMWKE